MRALLTGSVLALLSANSASAWDYIPKKDPIDDRDQSHVVVSAKDIISSAGTPFVIAFKCEYDGLNFVLSHKYLVGDSDDDVRVYLRFDEAEATSYWWTLHSTRTLTYADMSAVPSIIESARRGQKLTVRIVDPADGETLTSVFSLTGLSNQLSRLKC